MRVTGSASRGHAEEWCVMLRRWMRAYCEWDDRTYERLSARMRASVAWPVVLVVLVWASLTSIPVLIWTVNPATSWPKMVTGVLAIAAVCTLLGWHLVRGALLERRRRAGQCLHCGYDLRESPNTCRECGVGVTRAARRT
jgi:hypothetical protein